MFNRPPSKKTPFVAPKPVQRTVNKSLCSLPLLQHGLISPMEHAQTSVYHVLTPALSPLKMKCKKEQ
jgi:hypothetical protein